MKPDAQGMYVDRFYEMDPQFEDIRFGFELRNGMVVLVEDRMMRGNTDRMTGAYEANRCREANRWCTVARLRDSGEQITFVALYGDGTQRVRTYHKSHAWLVKRDSIGDTR